ncbi:MAG: hypothetical protein ABL883_02785 [Terricaulis sp.]
MTPRVKLPNRAWLLAAVAIAAIGMTPAHAEGPPAAELHVWIGNEAGDSSSVGVRSVEAAFWPTTKDRLGVRYDNSLSLDNPALARQGIDAEGYFVSYLHDFDGRFLLQGEYGQRDLANGGEQQIYKGESTFFIDGSALKFGAQVSPTAAVAGDYTDTVVWGQYNFAVSDRWRLEPALYLSESGAAGDREWRLAGYAEYNPSDAWQLGIGAGFGQIESDIANAGGEVFNAHARVTFNLFEHHAIHFQVRHEDSPLQEYTAGLVGVSLRMPRG